MKRTPQSELGAVRVVKDLGRTALGGHAYRVVRSNDGRETTIVIPAREPLP